MALLKNELNQVGVEPILLLPLLPLFWPAGCLELQLIMTDHDTVLRMETRCYRRIERVEGVCTSDTFGVTLSTLDLTYVHWNEILIKWVTLWGFSHMQPYLIPTDGWGKYNLAYIPLSMQNLFQSNERGQAVVSNRLNCCLTFSQGLNIPEPLFLPL